MAYPVLRSHSTFTSGNTTATSHAVPYPAGVVAGDLLIVQLAHAQGMATPAGYTRIRHTSGLFFDIYYKTAVGGETGNLTIETTGIDARRLHCLFLCIQDWVSFEQVIAAGNTATFPELNPTWTGKNTLRIAMGFAGGAGATQLYNAAPTGYSGFILAKSSWDLADSGAHTQQAVAFQEGDSSAFTPGALGTAGGTLYFPSSWTIAVEGTAPTRYGFRITDIKEPNEADQLVTDVTNARVKVWNLDDEGAEDQLFANQSITDGALNDIELSGVDEGDAPVVTVDWDAGGGETKFFRATPTIVDLDA